MKVDVAFTPDGFDKKIEKAANVAVIDVLRASSSIITALGHDARCVIPAASKDEALAISRTRLRKSILLCGEKDGLKIPGFDLGNSPREYTRDAVSGKILIFVSTNGSQMMVKTVRGKRSLFIAGFLNLKSVSARITQSGKDCLLVCSGREGQYSLEDSVCAGMMATEIRRTFPGTVSLSDEALSSLVLYRHFADDLAGMAGNSLHGRYLSGLGLKQDIPFCVSLNRFDAVPVFKKGALRAD
jgi:2-phosphosulfolactate phosphatase